MSTEKTYLGKKIQISNSKIGMQLSKKINPNFGTDYESIFQSMHSILESLARKTNCNTDKTGFLADVYSLGKVAGGENTLNYVNARIYPTKYPITEKDIMLQNLQSVFPNLEERFTEEELIEFVQLYMENPDTKETILVRMAYDLNLLLQYYKNTGNYKTSDIVRFIFKKTNEIANLYKTTGVLEFDEQTKNSLLNLKLGKLEFSVEEQEHLNNCISHYNNTGEKFQLINGLNDFRIKLEKKTKIR